MSVHSCGPNCTRPLCVANRRIEELENRPHDEVLLHDMELMQATITELQTKVEELEQEKTTLIKIEQEDSRYLNLLSETQSLRAKVEELTAAKNDAYSRGWVDALAEAHEWRNPTTVLDGE